MNDSKLFKPIEINSVEIKNRIAMAPMGIGGLVTQDGCFTKRARDYYIERAKGGTGLIITSVTKVENEIERIKPGIFPVVSANPTRFIKTASEMNEQVHAHGTKIFLQLTLGLGRVADPHILETEPVAPSALPNYWEPNVTCRALTTKEAETLVEKAVQGAETAKEAGFDGVEIHAVHEGYLLDQFTIDLFNNRIDKYGGELKDRLRFPTEIVQNIKDNLGNDFPVQLRYSIKNYIKDWNQGGLPEEEFEEQGRDVEEGLRAARILEQAGYDAFTADAGSYDAWYWAHPPIYQDYGCYLHLTKQLQDKVDVPLIIAGRMDDPELAMEAIEEGEAVDMVAIGRGLLTDPEWPNKVRTNQVEDIRPCIACHDGCLGRIFAGKPLSCAVNPACGREKEYDIPRTNETKDIAIVGGGLAGMEAARICALKGHKVMLYEKNDQLGGHVIAASAMEFKEAEHRLLDWYETQLDKLNVEIHLNKEVTLEDNLKEEVNEVIVATGSNYIKPDISGIEKEKVITASEALLKEKELEESIVIIGGGLVGCETALALNNRGNEVTIIEQQDDLMQSGIKIPHANKEMLLDLLNNSKVEIITNKSLFEVTDKGVGLIDDSFNQENLTANNIILASGLESDKKLYREHETEIVNLHLIGDALEAGNIMSTIWNSYEVARHI
ncbi:FAD-dependent oxidoreductase [Sporohalobacter salinus]|uniref:FAD-dependent oxidoreductase n=1 Tax=Sporohalobacter salinus TaxID=1494606 RepID=UPI00195F7FEF|nr:FAD-dependent oxidoreductase [Sporohalobacter salinus]MBM7624450.1 2-enoate reductase [Sporohalobacter salinus]